MKRMNLNGDRGHNLEQIKQYFSYGNILNEQIGPGEIIAAMKFHLRQGLENSEAIELFYGASKVFNEMEMFGSKARLFFRDDCVKLLRTYLDRDFSDKGNIIIQMASRMYGTFANFEFRMTPALHQLMHCAVLQKGNEMGPKQAARILNYYARTGDTMFPGLFDAAGKALTEKELIADSKIQVALLSNLAMLDAMNPDKSTFKKHSPESIYRVLAPLIEPFLGEDIPAKMRIAKEWFEKIAYTGARGFKAQLVSGELKTRLSTQGLSSRPSFDVAADGSTNTGGLDFVVEFEKVSVGIVCETRTGYAATFGSERVLRPNGKTHLGSAFLTRAYPGEIIVRLPGIVTKNISSPVLARALGQAAKLPPGIYGMNSNAQVVPFAELEIDS